ncbi:hypothetical protein [Clostridium fessum]|uniref:hypothetical protein n=1 Tax=Clostridium fessum TaxID=2126740 RepID=UPI0022E4E2DB|nr:hypothetical protein [Clostridium fessum]
MSEKCNRACWNCWYDEFCDWHPAGDEDACLNSWDARISKTLAYKYPCCEKCIAKEYDKTPGELREQMENFFGMRPCQGI